MRRYSFLLCLTLSACTALQEDKTRHWPAEQIYKEALSEQDGGHFERAAQYYEKVLARFPHGILAQQSAFNLAYSWHRAGEPEKALRVLDDFLRTYPQHPQIDYVYYMRGVIAYERKESLFKRITPINQAQTDPNMLRQAFLAFEELLKRFPQSRYAEDARQRMIYLRNVLGQHELEVAEYYLQQRAPVAAAERAQTVLEYYQQTPSVPYALAVLSRAYGELGDERRQQDAYQILEQNFPQMLQQRDIQNLLQGRIQRKDGLWNIINSQLKI